MDRIVVRVVVLMTGSLWLAGCTATPPTTPAPTATVTSTVTVTSTINAPSALPPSVSAATTDTPFFWSPSRNIKCLIQAGSDLTSSRVECSIDTSDFNPPDAPKDCDVDWIATNVNLYETGFTEVGECRGDVPPVALEAQQNNTVLDYGKVAARNGFLCTSATSGVTCWNQTSKHGFTLSRERLLSF